ncbi:hypothetical protein FACS1894200_11360 [Spirochaetia bacterium]|nr:hypothetical protein FACS1894200_11360 [Spirochaetia bacterium]
MSQIDELANEEARTRSELIREAVRMYIEKKENGSVFLIMVKALDLP